MHVRLQAESIAGTLAYLRAVIVPVLMSMVFNLHAQDLELSLIHI